MLPKPASCAACPFATTGLGFVPPEGDPKATIRVMLEAPGADEAEAGRPIVGKSGLIARRAMRFAKFPCRRCTCEGKDPTCKLCIGIGVTFPDVYIYNTIQCRPPNNDYTTVPQEAIAYCQKTHIAVAPQGATTFLVGSKALTYQFPALAKSSIEKWRGSVLPLEDGSITIPVIHPASVIYGKWNMLPLIGLDFKNGINRSHFDVPTVVADISPGPYLSLDVEGDLTPNSITFAGISTNGITVRQITRNNLPLLQPFVDCAELIFIHHAKYDVVDQLEPAGIRFDRTKVIDTCIAQSLY